MRIELSIQDTPSILYRDFSIPTSVTVFCMRSAYAVECNYFEPSCRPLSGLTGGVVVGKDNKKAE